MWTPLEKSSLTGAGQNFCWRTRAGSDRVVQASVWNHEIVVSSSFMPTIRGQVSLRCNSLLLIGPEDGRMQIWSSRSSPASSKVRRHPITNVTPGRYSLITLTLEERQD